MKKTLKTIWRYTVLAGFVLLIIFLLSTFIKRKNPMVILQQLSARVPLPTVYEKSIFVINVLLLQLCTIWSISYYTHNKILLACRYNGYKKLYVYLVLNIAFIIFVFVLLNFLISFLFNFACVSCCFADLIPLYIRLFLEAYLTFFIFSMIQMILTDLYSELHSLFATALFSVAWTIAGSHLTAVILLPLSVVFVILNYRTYCGRR